MKFRSLFGLIVGLTSSLSFAQAEMSTYRSQTCQTYRVITSQQPVTLRMAGEVSIAAINLDGVVLLFDKMKTVYAGELKEVDCIRVNYTGERLVNFLAPQVSSLIGKYLTFDFRASYSTTASGPVESLIQIRNTPVED